MSPNISKFIATFFYTGYCPVAPGTLASAIGAAIAFALRFNVAGYAFAMVTVTVLGFFFAGEAEKAIGKKDPGCIVIDEVSGIMISFFMLPLYWPIIVTGFFLFRAFDMFKIPPADLFEKMPGSRGIMLDDIMAGIYTNLILQIALRLSGAIW
ncbi:MAG: phosphatidylglycerophosphatase A [Candidatus Omnitrophica bacterium]|nr:phosphatidylglycerophosphatase A [Candidatus Omnitrophota bacterium]